MFFISLHCKLHYYTFVALHTTLVHAICIQLLDCIVESEPGNEACRKYTCSKPGNEAGRKIHIISKPGNEASREGTCS